jgi:hypothetical protein
MEVYRKVGTDSAVGICLQTLTQETYDTGPLTMVAPACLQDVKYVATSFDSMSLISQGSSCTYLLYLANVSRQSITSSRFLYLTVDYSPEGINNVSGSLFLPFLSYDGNGSGPGSIIHSGG